MERHADKVWACAVRGDDRVMVTGGADSALAVWRDCTAAEVEQEVRAQEERLLKEQQLLNALRGREFRKVRA